MSNNMKPRSGLVTDGIERAPARGMLRAVGMKDEDFAKANNLGLWKTNFEYPWDFKKKRQKQPLISFLGLI